MEEQSQQTREQKKECQQAGINSIHANSGATRKTDSSIQNADNPAVQK